MPGELKAKIIDHFIRKLIFNDAKHKEKIINPILK